MQQASNGKRAASSRVHGLVLATGILAVIAGVAAFQVFVVDRHRLAPTPAGMVLRLELPETRSPFNAIRVAPVPGGGAIVVDLGKVLDGSGVGPRSVVADYPSGVVRPGESAQWYGLELGSLFQDPEPIPLDLDGDGVEDRVEVGVMDDLAHGLVRVLSGVDGRVLFEDQDVLEYEWDDRAFSLGDLDGDGFGELALVHPRMRRTYDSEHVLDALFESRSWVTVVSGSRLFGGRGGAAE